MEAVLSGRVDGPSDNAETEAILPIRWGAGAMLASCRIADGGPLPCNCEILFFLDGSGDVSV